MAGKAPAQPAENSPCAGNSPLRGSTFLSPFWFPRCYPLMPISGQLAAYCGVWSIHISFEILVSGTSTYHSKFCRVVYVVVERRITVSQYDRWASYNITTSLYCNTILLLRYIVLQYHNITTLIYCDTVILYYNNMCT
jgi:hypothetical protein